MNNKIEKYKQLISREQIEELYFKENLNRKEVAERLQISLDCFCKLLKFYDIHKDIGSVVEKRKQTSIERYGVDNPSKSNEIKEKISEKNKSLKDEALEKRKQTNLERYGDAFYNNIEQCKSTKEERYGDSKYNNREKYKETMLEKYGVDNYFKLDECKTSNIDKLIERKNYSELFESIFTDRDKAIEFLKDKNYNYFDLSSLFNTTYYTVQQWVTRLDLKDYINYKFTGKSHYEDEIIDFIYSIDKDIKIERNTNKYLDDLQEIDIYLPDFKIGIEFNGNYWHSDLYKHKNYHQNKSKNAVKNGIRLIQIFQYEWDDLQTREKIKSIIKVSLGKVDKIIYARECGVREISNSDAREFTDRVHLQKHRNSQILLGLFYGDNLVEILTFSKSKYNKNLSGENEYEIIRSCSDLNTIVVGGVSKLFKYFIEKYKPSQVFSYCDFNKFNGSSYEKLGMKFIGYTTPDMKYVVKGEVISRHPEKYQEIKPLIDARIYGSGSKKYIFKV